mmetsp:Transcript_35474/g.50291  ORF Transcript_35474/g.50291 Transcript_35474/m.50291 type:complete len:424 (+) Transcript_35474:1404-2675(+)
MLNMVQELENDENRYKYNNRSVGAGHDTDDDEDDEVGVGARISVFWDEEGESFEGIITRERIGKQRYFIRYDDGDTEWINLAEEKFRVVEPKHYETRWNDTHVVGVGTRISVYWEDDEAYYAGVIAEERMDKKKNYLVKYDDGEEEWVNLSKEQYTVLFEDTKVADAAVDTVSLMGALPPNEPQQDSETESIVKKDDAANPQDDCVEWPISKDSYPVVKHVMIFQTSDDGEGPLIRGLPNSVIMDDKQTNTISLDGSTSSATPTTIMNDFMRKGTNTATICGNDGSSSGSVGEVSRGNSLEHPSQPKRGQDTQDLENEQIQHQEKHCQVCVGSRVSIYWAEDDEYYDGFVTRVRGTNEKTHFVKYDDGDEEWVDLSTERIKIWYNKKLSKPKQLTPTLTATAGNTVDNHESDGDENEWNDHDE